MHKPPLRDIIKVNICVRAGDPRGARTRPVKEDRQVRRSIVPKLIKLMAALLSLILVFAGCGTAGEEEQTSGPAGDATSEPGVATSQRLPDGVLLSIAGTEYRIIRPSNCADEVTNAAVELRLALNTALGVSFGIADDWV